MRNITIITILFLFICACGKTNPQQARDSLFVEDNSISLSDSLKRYVSYYETKTALVNATIINGTGDKILYEQTVIVENGYFKTIDHEDKVKIPTDARIIDLKGKTMIPGLVGVHNHLHIPGFPFIGDVASKLYLASGVTTIQTCGSASPKQDLALAQQISKGEKVGPDIITSGPYFTGAGGNPNMIIPRNDQHIKDTLQHWIRQGVSWFKVYRHTNPDDLKIIIDEAHRNNAKVTGHFCSITFEEATKMGIDGIEHGLNSASDFRTNKDHGVCNGNSAYIDELNISSPEVKQLQQLMIDNKVFLTSTLSIYESSIPNRAMADDRTLKAMSPYLINQYKSTRSSYDQEKQNSVREQRLKRIMEFEYQFFKMGGLLGSGVDAGRHILPGYGDQRNYELLIEAGFTTEEAIMILTKNGAKILKKDHIGSIESSKRADFVILNGDLVADSSTIRKVEYVFKEGIGYDPKILIEETNGKVGTE